MRSAFPFPAAAPHWNFNFQVNPTPPTHLHPPHTNKHPTSTLTPSTAPPPAPDNARGDCPFDDIDSLFLTRFVGHRDMCSWGGHPDIYDCISLTTWKGCRHSRCILSSSPAIDDVAPLQECSSMQVRMLHESGQVRSDNVRRERFIACRPVRPSPPHVPRGYMYVR